MWKNDNMDLWRIVKISCDVQCATSCDITVNQRSEIKLPNHKCEKIESADITAFETTFEQNVHGK